MSVHPSGMPVFGGLLDAGRALGRTMNEIVRVRGALFAVELHEEVERRKTLFALALVAIVLLHTALLLVTVLGVAIFWDTHRLASLAAMAAAYAGMGALALARLRAGIAACPQPFAATRQELARDLAELHPRP